MDTIKDKFIATLLAGAIGDALGYPVEFLRAPVPGTQLNNSRN